ncbi:MAG: UDP-glucose/GDP-mannose dehydrogenase family protein [Actinobacteria bacterium]|nr:UDP-glucose/GDP-mannose dehydrogenase family protein [Actinomycetota bacterium]
MAPAPDHAAPAAPRRLAVLGAGYVGLTTAAGFAHAGHRVRVGEADARRLAALQAGESPITEPGLAALVAAGVAAGRLEFCADNAAAAADAEAVFVAVPTPEGAGGRVDLSFVMAALAAVAAVVGPSTPLVIKSSVPPGTAARLTAFLRELGCAAPVVVNPEFLQEGRAVQDVLHPYRVVVGSDDRDAAALVAGLHEPFGAPVVIGGAASAELAKYAANAYLATRLTFVNAIAHLAEAVGADAGDVLVALSLDPRVGPHYLRPGPGYGGSCFPKDVRALVAAAGDHGHDLKLLRAVVETNDDQLDRVAAKVRTAAGGLQGKVVGLLGLAFKGGTADTRSSPAVALAERLTAAGASVQAYDPAARVDLPGVVLVPDAVAAAAGADVLLVATEWEEFAALEPAALAAVMRGRAVVDARNLLDRDAVEAAGLEYRGLGR